MAEENRDADLWKEERSCAWPLRSVARKADEEEVREASSFWDGGVEVEAALDAAAV